MWSVVLKLVVVLLMEICRTNNKKRSPYNAPECRNRGAVVVHCGIVEERSDRSHEKLHFLWSIVYGGIPTTTLVHSNSENISEVHNMLLRPALLCHVCLCLWHRGVLHRFFLPPLIGPFGAWKQHKRELA